MSTILESVLTSQQRAEAVAADMQRAEWERARCIDLPAANAAHAALQNALAFRGARFSETYCSQCGCELGAGDSGTSSCIDHIRRQKPLAWSAPGSALYADFQSEFLGGDVRIGYEIFEAEQHAFFPQSAGADITEVWIGGIDMGPHLASLVSDILQAELREHLRGLN